MKIVRIVNNIKITEGNCQGLYIRNVPNVVETGKGLQQGLSLTDINGRGKISHTEADTRIGSLWYLESRITDCRLRL